MTFSEQLLSWYHENKRDLPWRQTRDPYLIWLSEIIMQQTRIEQGLPYYRKFAETWPTVAALAAADEQEILKLWQGLGYYSRARNLHKTAKEVAGRHSGRFPVSREALLGLKGIGEYTAAAIASIAFDQPSPVVDGNVTRFVARYCGITAPAGLPATRRLIHAFAGTNLDARHPGDFNQAMMEFGAMVCTPVNPKCSQCIFSPGCNALAGHLVDSIPARLAKPPVRQRNLHYLVITFNDAQGLNVFLNRRTGNDIWKNLFDFPVVETNGAGELSWESGFSDFFPSGPPLFLGVSRLYTHQLTHQKLHARFYRFHAGREMELPFMAVPAGDLPGYPIPRLVERYLTDYPVAPL